MSDKIVYIAAAIRGGNSVQETVRFMIDFIKSLGIPVLSEHIGAADVQAAFRANSGISDPDSEDIERQDIKWVSQATHVIAEVSSPSTGSGREIEYARMKHLEGKVPARILCLYRVDHAERVSAMVRGMSQDRYPNVTVGDYADHEELKTWILTFLND